MEPTAVDKGVRLSGSYPAKYEIWLRLLAVLYVQHITKDIRTSQRVKKMGDFPLQNAEEA